MEGGASALVVALVLDLVLAAGVVAFGADGAVAFLHCFRFSLLIVFDSMNCAGDVVVGTNNVLENACAICCVACLIDCDMDCFRCWAGDVLCTLRTAWVLIGFVACTLGSDGVMMADVANVVVMVECWWMACLVNSTSSLISSVPWERLCL